MTAEQLRASLAITSALLSLFPVKEDKIRVSYDHPFYPSFISPETHFTVLHGPAKLH